jgi:hypothetical protein
MPMQYRKINTVAQGSHFLHDSHHHLHLSLTITLLKTMTITILCKYFFFNTSWDSSVRLATDYGLYGRGVGVQVLVGSRIFSSHSPPLGPIQPPIQWVPGGALNPGVKWTGREADHSPPTSAEVNLMWICTSSPPCVFMVQCLIT